MYYQDQIFKGPSSGQLFESVVLGEIIRGSHMKGELPRVYWWRTSHGEEIDFIVEQGQKIIPTEVKLASRVNQGLIKNPTLFCELFKGEVEKGLLINLSSNKLKMSDQIESIPFHEFMRYSL